MTTHRSCRAHRPSRRVDASCHCSSRRPSTALSKADAENYAEWFAVLADPTRVRLLHTLSTSPAGRHAHRRPRRTRSGSASRTCSHHVELLKKVGFVSGRQGRHRRAWSRSTRPAAPACRTPPTSSWAPCPHRRAAPRTCPPTSPRDPCTDDDMPAVLAIYEEGLATRNATFETRCPTAKQLRARWLPGLAWVAELDGEVVGWTAVTPGVGPGRATPASARPRSTSPRPPADAASARRCCSPRSSEADTGRDVDAADLDLP